MIQFGISEMYSLGLYAPYHRDKTGLINNINPKNNESRVMWLKKSANNKKPYVGAAYQLGEAYYYGRDDLNIEKDYSQAIFYYKLASKLGAPYATGQLASMYSEGIGVPKDYFKSYIFNNITLSQCDDKYLEKYRLAVLEDMKNDEKKLDKQLINKAQKISSKCVESKFNECEVY
jgi:TPR repeat protein